MIKGEKTISSRVVIIVVFILLINVFGLLFNYGNLRFNKTLTGNSIVNTLSKTYGTMPFLSKIFFIVQWSALFLVIFIALFRDKGIINRKKEIAGVDLSKMSKNSKTDLDTLYNIIQNKKEIRVSTISKLFKVNKDVAMEWCRILESGNLAVIDYPGFGEPVVKLAGYKQEKKGKIKEEIKKKNENENIKQKKENISKKQEFKKIDKRQFRLNKKAEKKRKRADEKLRKIKAKNEESS